MLAVQGNELGNEGVKAICQALLDRQSPISALDFGNNRCATFLTLSWQVLDMLILTQSHGSMGS